MHWSRLRSVEQELKTLARQMPEVARLTNRFPSSACVRQRLYSVSWGFLATSNDSERPAILPVIRDSHPGNIPSVATGDTWAGSVSTGRALPYPDAAKGSWGPPPCCGVPIESRHTDTSPAMGPPETRIARTQQGDRCNGQQVGASRVGGLELPRLNHSGPAQAACPPMLKSEYLFLVELHDGPR